MKASTETLSPTRVKLTVEVPFAELEPAVASAYKRISRQVRVAGFRPGKVPPRILDQRVGRGAVLDEAVQEALPRFYGEALEEASVRAIGRPEVDITAFADGEPLVFTAEVDVRPEIELPPYDGIEVSVEDADLTDEQVAEQIEALRDRFAVLVAADRPAATGDYVTLDLAATVDGEPVPGADATNLSYEVGSNSLMPGLDDAIDGAAAGETRTFTSDLVSGELAGRTAEVTVTVRSVKDKQLPELDDDFAQTASEFDTLDELRAEIRTRQERINRLEQGIQARDRVLAALLDRVEVPLPESVVAAEIQAGLHNLAHQLQPLGMDLDGYLERLGRSREDFETETRREAERSVKTQFVLDAVSSKEELGLSEAEIADQVVRRAQRAGMDPNLYAQRLTEAGQGPALMAEILRGKALALVLERATITDASGRPVDLSALAEVDPAASDHEHDHEHGHDHDHDHGGSDEAEGADTSG